MSSGVVGAQGPGPPKVPPPTHRLPLFPLWAVPFALVLLYVLLITTFYGHEARWTGLALFGVTFDLVLVTLLFSALWFGTAYLANLAFGELVPWAVLELVSRVPVLDRHVVIAPARRPDSRVEVWGRFGILFLFTLGFDLILLIIVLHRGDLDPRLAVTHPVRIIIDEAVVGVLLAAAFAPAAPFLASRLRVRITDSLPFPLLWLAALLLVLGGSTILLVEVFPGVVLDPSLFLISVLLYAPAAWYVSLAFSRTETEAQGRFLARAWRHRSPKFHFGDILVKDDPEGTTTRT
jgi:hypothetical protein